MLTISESGGVYKWNYTDDGDENSDDDESTGSERNTDEEEHISDGSEAL